MTFSRKSLIGTFALVASLSAPLAFAQSAAVSAQATSPTETAAPTETSVQANTSMQAQTGAASATTDATVAAAAASPAKKSWADVDGDKDGKLTKAEAAVVPALGQVFDQADGNTDGALTADEYKAYVAKVQGKAPAGGGGGK